MPEPCAVRFDGVTKRYRLVGSQRDQLLEVLGLKRLLGSRRPDVAEHTALDSVSFELPRGSRYGLIGRNGAGKTTLLKLISGNFGPSSGKVEVKGAVQALLTMGHGFHPEFTGYENIRSSLQYNGLSRAETEAAVDDIVEFCELGLFLHQPFKTYSSGMQSRLLFATATAIRPDILIVDEILGAGDAYFIAKSKRRVDKLVSSGCTLMLVSHSMPQVMELCDQTIWLDQGRIKLIGPTLQVIKAYEESLYGPISRLDAQTESSAAPRPELALAHSNPATSDGGDHGAANLAEQAVASRRERRLILQIPTFLSHSQGAALEPVPDSLARTMNHPAPGGLSRWAGESGLKIVGFSISGPQGPTDKLVSLQPASFTIFLMAEETGFFECTYGIAIHDFKGRDVIRIISPEDRFAIKAGEGRRIEIVLNPNQIGPGDYTLGISILEASSIENLNAAKRYDLLSRSFRFRVELPDSLAPISCEFFHTAEWSFASAALPAAQPLHPETEAAASA